MEWPTPTVPEPDMRDVMEDLEAHVFDEETHFETSDGCTTDADGVCYHGHPTWLVRFGLI